MAASTISTQSLKAAMDHNSSVLESVLKTLQDVQITTLRMDRRILSLEDHLGSILSGNVQDSAKVCEITDQGLVENVVVPHSTQNVAVPHSIDNISQKISADIRAQMKKDLDETSKDLKAHIKSELAVMSSDLISQSKKEQDDIFKNFKSHMKEKLDDLSKELKSQCKKDQEVIANNLHSRIKNGLDNIVALNDKHNKNIIKNIGNLEQSIHSQRERLTSSNCEVKSTVDTLCQRLSQIEINGLEIKDRVQKLTTISVFQSTKLKESMNILNDSMNSSFSKNSRNLTKQATSVKTLEDCLKTLETGGYRQLLSIQNIEKELGVGGQMNRRLSHHCQAVIDQVVAEGQLIRAMKDSPERLKDKNTYICDLHVTEFSKSVGEDTTQYSRMWLINNANMYVKGQVRFNSRDNSINVHLCQGQYPNVLGVKGKEKVLMTVKVTLIGGQNRGDTGGQSEDETWELGSEECDIDEGKASAVCDGWCSVAYCGSGYTLSCDEIFRRGFVQCDDKITVRYTITPTPFHITTFRDFVLSMQSGRIQNSGLVKNKK